MQLELCSNFFHTFFGNILEYEYQNTNTLKQQDDLQEYFEEYKLEISCQVSEFELLDRKLDELVYALYNLTLSEIEIIEKV